MTRDEARAALDGLHPGEPCFVLRAADWHSWVLLLEHASRLRNLGEAMDADGMDAEVEEFRRWQKANPDLTNRPPPPKL